MAQRCAQEPSSLTSHPGCTPQESRFLLIGGVQDPGLESVHAQGRWAKAMCLRCAGLGEGVSPSLRVALPQLWLEGTLFTRHEPRWPRLSSGLALALPQSPQLADLQARSAGDPPVPATCLFSSNRA